MTREAYTRSGFDRLVARCARLAQEKCALIARALHLKTPSCGSYDEQSSASRTAQRRAEAEVRALQRARDAALAAAREAARQLTELTAQRATVAEALRVQLLRDVGLAAQNVELGERLSRSTALLLQARRALADARVAAEANRRAYRVVAEQRIVLAERVRRLRAEAGRPRARAAKSSECRA